MAAQNTANSPDPARREADFKGLFSIKEVSQACGLPDPVIMQLVPRTWVEPFGWLYTEDQISRAIAISQDLPGSPRINQRQAQRDAIYTLSCQRCAALSTVADAAARGWLNVIDPDSTGLADLDGKDYCAQCVRPCPSCSTDDRDRQCLRCFGARRVPKPPLATHFVQLGPARRP